MSGEHIIIGVAIALAGLFSVVCAAKDYDWFMGNQKAKAAMWLLGRTGARIFYIVLGAALVVVGVCLVFGVLR